MTSPSSGSQASQRDFDKEAASTGPADADVHAGRIMGASRIGAKVASSRKCDIHAISKHEVIKIYSPDVPLEDIERCASLSYAVYQTGLPVPRSHPLPVKIHDGRYGIIFDRVHGPTLSEQMFNKPAKLAHFTRILAAQHKIVHSRSDVAGLPLQHEVLARKIARLDALGVDEQSKLLRLLESLPAGNTLCHGDFHCENVIAGKDRHMFIDWGDATLGNALGDIARTWLIMRFVTGLGWMARAYCWLFAGFYERNCLRGTTCSRKELGAWKLIYAAVRLGESVPERELAHLRRYVRASMARFD
jgi:aminoglycoside phosphotransferase (APT) family kinase protein